MFPGSICDEISSPAVWDLMRYNLKNYEKLWQIIAVKTRADTLRTNVQVYTYGK